MRYINTVNGLIIESDFEINGKNWQKYEVKEQVEEEVVKETEPDPVETEETEDFDLTKMTIAELKDYAKENEIDLSSDVTEKDDIIQVIADTFQG